MNQSLDQSLVHPHIYRDPERVKSCLSLIESTMTQPWTIMEVCGGQTHAIVKYGLDQLLPESLHLIHGPGCPVCVTPQSVIDHALAIAEQKDVVFCSFGDMLRVPGRQKSLMQIKSQGGDVRVVYSPLDAVAIAEQEPDKQVVFFAVGFETTAPANAMAIEQARQKKLKNFSALVSQVTVPPALMAISSQGDSQVQGYLAAGHVCTITGYQQYHRIAEQYRLPIVVTGFEPLDILQGVYLCIKQLEQGDHFVENQYRRSVREAGNPAAQALLEKVFHSEDREWRGIGWIPQSGLGIAPAYREFDAARRFPLTEVPAPFESECISGEILIGKKTPHQCPAFGKNCTPAHPLGATMVSSEGACAAYYRYRPDRVNHDG